MKLKLFLLFITGIVLLGIGTAQAQCPEAILLFPPPTSDGSITKVAVQSGMCISAANQAARLRWNNNNSGLLQLFDTDEGGSQIWCDGINDPGGCQPGGSLCLQSDGNMVVYTGTSCNGAAVWASGTVGANSANREGLRVLDENDGQEHIIIEANVDTSPVIVWQRP
jgi:hypothetical protein